MTLKTVIVDDEKHALTLIADYINKAPSLELVAQFQDAIQALEYLSNNQVDLLFLDIQMPDLSGIDLLNSLQVKPLVIFTTAYPEYAVEGFQLDAIDYLVKPILFPRFLKAVNKASTQVQYIQQVTEGKSIAASPAKDAPQREQGYIFVKVDSHWERIQLAEITYIEACGDYISINLQNRKRLMCLQTLSDMEKRLDGADFVRVHRSYIVNLAKVDTIEKDHLLIEDQDITISKGYRQAFLNKIGKK